MPLPLYDWIRGATEDELRAFERFYDAPKTAATYAGTLTDIRRELDRRRHGRIMSRVDDGSLSDDERQAISDAIADAQRMARAEAEREDNEARARARLDALLKRAPPAEVLARERPEWAPDSILSTYERGPKDDET